MDFRFFSFSRISRVTSSMVSWFGLAAVFGGAASRPLGMWVMPSSPTPRLMRCPVVGLVGRAALGDGRSIFGVAADWPSWRRLC